MTRRARAERDFKRAKAQPAWRRLFPALCGAIFLTVLTAPHAAIAQKSETFADSGLPVRRITVTRHKSRTIKLNDPFSTAVVGSPEIADVLPMSDTVLYIQGKKLGATNISVF